MSSWAAMLGVWLVALAVAPPPAAAHEIRPAIADITVEPDRVVLEIRLALESLVAGLDLQGLQDTNEAVGAERYDALRALPPAELGAALRAAWPQIAPKFRLVTGGAALPLNLDGVAIPEAGDLALPRDSVLRLSAALPPGEAPILFGWSAAFGPIVLRQMGVEEADAYTGYLTDGAPSDPLPRTGAATQSWAAAFAAYVLIGFEHIVPKGLDHILFVLGLFFFSLHLRPLLYQVTAFTAAHTVTLALATLGIVSIPPAIVEPLIAASIVFVAVENVFFTRMHPWRTAVVFGFGLLHGLGFAAVLGEIGLSPGRFLTGLIGFNVGVELGQLAVIAGAYLAVGLWFGKRPWYRGRIAVPISAAIAFVGAYWFIERTLL